MIGSLKQRTCLEWWDVLVRSIGVLACVCTAGCRENSLLDRSLIFSTHTAAGIELAVNPAEVSGAPAKLMIGYSRTEGVINPVYDSRGAEEVTSADGTAKTVRRYREPEAYSVLAKFAGTAGADARAADAAAGVSQWFATGQAALILANQPGIAGAVTGSAEIARATAATSKPAPADAGLVAAAVYEALAGLAAQGDAHAAAKLAALDVLGEDVPPQWVEWRIADGRLVRETCSPPEATDAGFALFNLYLQSLHRSAAALESQADAAAKRQLVRVRRLITDALGPTSDAARRIAEALDFVQSRMRHGEVPR